MQRKYNIYHQNALLKKILQQYWQESSDGDCFAVKSRFDVCAVANRHRKGCFQDANNQYKNINYEYSRCITSRYLEAV